MDTSTSLTSVAAKDTIDPESKESTTIKHEKIETSKTSSEGSDKSHEGKSEDLEDLNYRTIGYNEKVAGWVVQAALNPSDGMSESDADNTDKGYKRSVTPVSQILDDDSIKTASAIRAGFSPCPELERELEGIRFCYNENPKFMNPWTGKHELQTYYGTDFKEKDDKKVDKYIKSNDDNFFLMQKWIYKKISSLFKDQADGASTDSSYSFELTEENSHSHQSENVHKQMGRQKAVSKKTTAEGSTNEDLLKYHFQTHVGTETDNESDKSRKKLFTETSGRKSAFSRYTRSNTDSHEDTLSESLPVNLKSILKTYKLASTEPEDESLRRFVELEAKLAATESEIDDRTQDIKDHHEHSREILDSMIDPSSKIDDLISNIEQRYKQIKNNLESIRAHQYDIHDILYKIKEMHTINVNEIREYFD